MPSKTTSYHDQIYRKVADIADEQDESFSQVANRLIDRGLEEAGHVDEPVMPDD